MSTKQRTPTVQETHRLKAARLCIFIFLLVMLLLAVWSHLESPSLQTGILDVIETMIAEDTSTAVLPPGHQTSVLAESETEAHDPLRIAQEGIVFKEMNERGSIMWYHSNWSVSQSKILFERTLALKGWCSNGDADEPFMTFSFAPSATAEGGSLIASFYETGQGCSILVELL